MGRDEAVPGQVNITSENVKVSLLSNFGQEALFLTVHPDVITQSIK